jgi:protein ImuA
MGTSRPDIIVQLQREILSLQGLRKTKSFSDADLGLGIINEAFPNKNFPLAAVHEFICIDNEHASATSGFISCIVSSLMHDRGTAVWIGREQKIFPPALKSFGILPDKIIFINTKNQQEILWCMEEALKCEGLAAVVCEIKEISFTESRRLQLTVEKSRVTGFILRDQPRNIGVNACVSRWKISSIQSEATDLPGIGFPRWNIELLKIRNGKPGSWQAEWSNGKLQIIDEEIIVEEQKRKAS